MKNDAPVSAQPVSAQPVSAQQGALLERLRLSPGAVTVPQLAAAVGLHTNTVREHLEALVARGLIRRERGEAHGRGRPAWRYVPEPGTPERDRVLRDYVTLTRVLADQLAAVSRDPAADAVRAGEGWGRLLADEHRLAASRAGEDPTGQGAEEPELELVWPVVVEMLAELGFSPGVDPATGEVVLLRCPFVDAARPRPEVICGVHLGIVRGVLAGLGAGSAVVELQPFTSEGTCRLVLDPPVALPEEG
ncbi:MAG: MarR family transcriptional regulator [Actinomycetales bacterium]|nr:MarR family transcriptional regulator [Actinomycetales bacterium]